ncbi:MAG: CPCC family cysteine-rich protein [Planctomycetota bacterium]
MGAAGVACPCCGFLTLEDPGGFEMCPVCWWEDDGQGDADAEVARGGPNGTLSLAEARANFRSIGASAPEFVQSVRLPFPGRAALIDDAGVSTTPPSRWRSCRRARLPGAGRSLPPRC